MDLVLHTCYIFLNLWPEILIVTQFVTHQRITQLLHIVLCLRVGALHTHKIQRITHHFTLCITQSTLHIV